MRNIEEKTSEGKLKKFVKNLDVLVPFKGIYERFIKKDSSWSVRKTFDQTAISALLTGAYLSMAGSIGPNPFNWSKIIEDNHARQDSIRNEYQIKKQAFPSNLYQEIAGDAGVIDSQEFADFYSKADSVGGICYPKLSEFYNKKK